MTTLSVVAPVYNENEATLTELVTRLSAVLQPLCTSYEIVLVDDGSKSSWPIIRTLAASHPYVKGVRFSRNFGQHQAISAGLEATTGDWVIVMDSDLQDRPEVIPDLLRKAEEGFDVVFVARKQRPETPIYQFAGRLFFRIFKFLAGTSYNAEHGNFSIVARRVVDAYCRLPENFRFYGGLLNWLGFRHAEIPAQHGERFSGESGYTLMKRIRFAVAILLSFSDKPLTMSIYVGLFFAALSLLIGLNIAFNALVNHAYTVPGWASTIAAIFLMGGLNLIVLGLIGAFLGRVFTEVKHRPGYVVAETLNIKK